MVTVAGVVRDLRINTSRRAEQDDTEIAADLWIWRKSAQEAAEVVFRNEKGEERYCIAGGEQ